jgi:hypothetical protein
MTADTIGPHSARDDRLLIAAILEALPGTVALVAIVLLAVTTGDDALNVAFEALFMWFDPQQALTQTPLRTLLSVAMLLAYVGPGLGRLYLRDREGIGKYLGMRVALIIGALFFYAMLGMLLFGAGSNSSLIVAVVGLIVLGLAPLIASFASAWELFERHQRATWTDDGY